jgi:hypothetical protein
VLEENKTEHFEFEEEIMEGTRAGPPPDIPKYHDMKDKNLAKLEKKLEDEKKRNLEIERKNKNLKEQAKNYKNQLMEKPRRMSGAGSALRVQERDEIKKDLEKAYQKKIDKLYKEIDGENKRLRKERDHYKKKIKSTSPKDRDRKDRSTERTGSPYQLPYASHYLAMPGMGYTGMYPPLGDKSRLIGTNAYVDEDLAVLPPPPTVPIQMPTTFDLSRDDEIAFVKLGIKDEILKAESIEEPLLEIENRNPLKASEFSIRFIAFKPPLAMPFGQTVPRKMYFKFHFFCFPETRSEICVLKDTDGRIDLTSELIPGQQYILEELGKKSALKSNKSVQ